MNRTEAGRIGGLRGAGKPKAGPEEQAAYLRDPLLCMLCGNPVPFRVRNNKKYCCQRCSLIAWNIKMGRVIRITHKCLVCGGQTILDGGLCRSHQKEDDFNKGAISQRSMIRVFLVKRYGKGCQNCGGKEWLGNEMPTEVHHVDGNPSNNLPENLQLLCPNCHALTATSKGRNRGNGRTARGLRKS